MVSWDDFVESSVDEARDFGTVQHRVVRRLLAPLAASISHVPERNYPLLLQQRNPRPQAEMRGCGK